jgi:hypothetical protein
MLRKSWQKNFLNPELQPTDELFAQEQCAKKWLIHAEINPSDDPVRQSLLRAEKWYQYEVRDALKRLSKRDRRAYNAYQATHFSLGAERKKFNQEIELITSNSTAARLYRERLEYAKQYHEKLTAKPAPSPLKQVFSALRTRFPF